MNNKNLPRYCVVNYQSERGIDDKPSYNFWFTSSLIRLIGDKPFGRGDIILLNDIKKTDYNEWSIECEVIGDPEINKEARELCANNDTEIPTLMFVTTKIYLHEDADLHLFSTDNIEILLSCPSVMNNNKSYTVVSLVKGKQGKISGIDKVNGTPVSWLITDNP